jgi:hypothetical protein
VTPGDVATETGIHLTGDLEARWALWIDRTVRQIQRRAERLGVDFDDLSEQTVDDVVLLAVAAHARNPEGVDTVDVSADDGRVSRRYAKSAGEVSITDLWWSWLFPSVESGAFSVRPGFEPDEWSEVAL